MSTGGGFKETKLAYDAAGRALRIKPPLATDQEAQTVGYNGLTAVRSSFKNRGNRSDDEFFLSDAMANVARSNYDYSFTYLQGAGPSHDMRRTGGKITTNTYAAGVGRLLSGSERHYWADNPLDPTICGGVTADGWVGGITRVSRHDAAGNRYWTGGDWRDTLLMNPCHPEIRKAAEARAMNYFDALDRLRIVDAQLRQDHPSQIDDSPCGFEEHRYDALGRRVLRRIRDGCRHEVIQRYVWDGQELAAEIQYPGGGNLTAAELERDTATLAGPSEYFGRVLYLPGETIDQPLSIVRIGYSRNVGSTLTNWDPIAMVTHWDHRGAGYDHAFYGPTSHCKTVGSVTACSDVTWMTSLVNPGQPGIGVGGPYFPQPLLDGWFGSLPLQQQDGSGQFYRRNRFYDPVSARFTQEDPIGLAGGINVYGFAGGDPVNFSDPFGLCPGRFSFVCRAANWAVSHYRSITGAATVTAAAVRVANTGAKLPASEVRNFAAGKAQQVTVKAGEMLYGVRDAGSRTVWWTRNMPQTVEQTRRELAVSPEWNKMTHVDILQVPKGQSLLGFEGSAAAQGSLPGGGNQLFVPSVPAEWITRLPW